MAFTAKDVQALREKTGVGMMDCKKALTEADGDVERAVDILREKGLAAAAKKSGRIAAEGAVLAYQNTQNTLGAIVEVNAETDFVAKNESFRSFVLTVAETVAEQNPDTMEILLSLKPADSAYTMGEMLNEKVLTIGENIKIRRFARYDGYVATYVHGGGRIGVIVKFDVSDATAAKPELQELGKDIAMQIAAANPLYLNKNTVPTDVLEHEKRVLTEQVLGEGKPAAIAEKIVAGKIGKYYKENCLVDQPYIKDGEISVQQHIDAVAKSLGGAIAVLGFERFEKGEGLEKRSDDFAAEIASLVK